MFGQEIIQVTFLGHHGFAFDDVFRVVSLANVQDDLVGLQGGFGPVHLNAVGDQIAFQLDQVLPQVVQGPIADRAGQVPGALELKRIGELCGATLAQAVHGRAKIRSQGRVI